MCQLDLLDELKHFLSWWLTPDNTSVNVPISHPAPTVADEGNFDIRAVHVLGYALSGPGRARRQSGS